MCFFVIFFSFPIDVADGNIYRRAYHAKQKFQQKRNFTHTHKNELIKEEDKVAAPCSLSFPLRVVCPLFPMQNNEDIRII